MIGIPADWVPNAQQWHIRKRDLWLFIVLLVLLLTVLVLLVAYMLMR